ncbi:MAG TPA: hypothetical protein VKX34_02660 [Aequorivita sp.]|nr:hypothetical protein [Aequorivita sp.]
MAYLGQRTFVSFEKKARGWGDFFEEEESEGINSKAFDNEEEITETPEPHWQSLTPYNLVKELGYDWNEVKSLFALKNPELKKLEDKDKKLNKWIKVSIIRGWRMGMDPPYHRDIIIDYDLEKNAYIIEAWDYNEAVAKAREIGLLETDTFYWRHKLSGDEEHQGLRKAKKEDWWNFQNVQISSELLSKMGRIAENTPLATEIASIAVNPTLNPLFSRLVKEVQEKIFKDNVDKITGMLDAETLTGIELEMQNVLRKEQNEYEQSFNSELGEKSSFQEYYYQILNELATEEGDGEFGGTLEIYAEYKKSEFATTLLALSENERNLYMAIITYEAEKQRHRDTKIDPNIQTFPELIPALEKDIELFRKSRYIEVNKLIEEQIDILNNYYSSSAEKSEAQDKINYYEQLKTPLLETDPDAIIKKMNESVEEVFVSDDEFQTARSYMPPNISPKVAFDIYFITLIEEYKDLGAKLGYLTPEGYNKTTTSDKIGAMLRSTFVGLSADEQRYLNLHFELQNMMGAFLFNENPLVQNPESNVWDVGFASLAEVYLGELATGLFATDQIVAQMTQNALGNTGVTSEELTTDAESTINQTAEEYGAFTAKGWAQLLGTSLGFMTQFMGAGGLIGAGARALQWGRAGILISRLGAAGNRVLNMTKASRVLASSRVTKWLYAGLKTGIHYTVSGKIFKNSQEEANFWAGFLGGLGGTLAKGLFFKIFGKVANKAISKIIEINGRAGGEVTEETVQALLHIHRESGSFDEMMTTVGEMFESSDGDYSDAFKLFVQSYTMGMAFGTGSTLSSGMFNFAQKQQNKIPANEQELAKQYVEELNETYLLALEVAVIPDAQTSTTGTNINYTVTEPISAPSYLTMSTPAETTTNNLKDNLLFYENLLQQGVVNVRYANVEISVEQAISVLKTGDVEGFKKLFESDYKKSGKFEIEKVVKENISKIGSYDAGLIRRYIQHIEQVTGRALHPKQIDKLKEALRNKEYKKLTPKKIVMHRSEFNKVKNDLIKKWEKETGQTWPKYKEPYYSKKTGEIYKSTGDPYDAHHIIENKYGGDNDWWNIHPAKFPDEHQLGIHGPDSPANELFK